MDTLILNSKSSSDLKLLADLARKLGINLRFEILEFSMITFIPVRLIVYNLTT